MSNPPSSGPLRGIVVPLVTPLAGADELDIDGLARLVDRVLRGGVHGLFVLGTCGEGPSLSSRLQRELVERVCRQVAGAVPIWVGVTHSAPAESAALARHAADAGAQAIATAPPFYFPLTQAELVESLHRLAADSPLPLVLYNMPALTGMPIELDSVERLLENPKIIGLKDSSGDMNYCRRACAIGRGRSDWTTMVGPEHMLAEAIEQGAHGGVTGGGNVWPELYVRIYEAARSGFADELATLESNAARFGRIYAVGICFSGASVVRGLKAALEILGVCDGRPGPPLAPLSPSEFHEVRKILDSLGLTRSVDPAVAAQQQ